MTLGRGNGYLRKGYWVILRIDGFDSPRLLPDNIKEDMRSSSSVFRVGLFFDGVYWGIGVSLGTLLKAEMLWKRASMDSLIFRLIYSRLAINSSRMLPTSASNFARSSCFLIISSARSNSLDVCVFTCSSWRSLRQLRVYTLACPMCPSRKQ